MKQDKDLSIYIHYPFCLSKCPYCDFNSYKLTAINQVDFLNAYLLEIENYYNLLKNREIKTIFFGGGTPSIMSIDFASKIINKINDLWGIGNIEISMEANPTTVEIGKFCDFNKIGINRLSIGIQSLNDDWLKFFGRMHNKAEAIKAIEIAQKIFEKRYSIDLIYARPKQKINDWLNELEEAVKLSPYHISLYQLIIEEGTKFFEIGIKTLGDKKASEMYNITNDFLENKNINIYEVSNYAKSGFECRHNLNYWDNGEWIGVGAGAHGRVCFGDDFVDGYKIRTSVENYKSPQKWIDSVLQTGFGCEIKEDLTKEEFIEEVLLMGLRLRGGIKLENVKKYLIVDSVKDIVSDGYNGLVKDDLVVVNNGALKVNVKYFNVLDSIIEKLMK
ncbi:MAG: radical SAM family heme chaperone HemW [Rickettsiales bacterium]|nr:radical SAM family heme chaperone HemW [Rickettsiales bacterium]